MADAVALPLALVALAGVRWRRLWWRRLWWRRLEQWWRIGPGDSSFGDGCRSGSDGGDEHNFDRFA